jgi:mRNA interferase RelE/StbE
MEYKIIFLHPKKIDKNCKSIPPHQLRKIFDEIEKLATFPFPQNTSIKMLQHYDLADYRLRVGAYRVLFDIDHEQRKIVVICIKHRSRLY